ncbi:MAG TPA: ribosome silencing factor [Bacteroidia bacterium]|jgi:ribosome-associated protein
MAKQVKQPKKTQAKKTVKKKKNESTVLAEAVIEGLQEKKGREIAWLNLQKIEGAVCDHFIICEAGSTTQIEALSRSVEETVQKRTGQKPWHSEGKQNAQWILIDYVSVVVHIFQSEMRQFYNLEGLWADAEVMEVKD